MALPAPFASDLSTQLHAAPTHADHATRPYDRQFRVLTLGASGVGKTSLVLRFVHNVFKDVLLSTVGIDHTVRHRARARARARTAAGARSPTRARTYTRTHTRTHPPRCTVVRAQRLSQVRVVEIGGARIRLQIWDTAGQERFHALAANYTRGADAVVIVYNIGSADSFEQAKRWLSKELGAPERHIVRMLVGNKLDDEEHRSVATSSGQAAADAASALFFEASARRGTNVEEAFMSLATELAHLHKVGTTTPTPEAAASNDTVKLAATSTAPAGSAAPASGCAC